MSSSCGRACWARATTSLRSGRPSGGGMALPQWWRQRKRIDNRELLAFNQELVVLLKAGMPIVPVLDAILEHRNKVGGPFAQVLTKVREDVKGGSALSTALERHGDLVSAALSGFHPGR